MVSKRHKTYLTVQESFIMVYWAVLYLLLMGFSVFIMISRTPATKVSRIETASKGKKSTLTDPFERTTNDERRTTTRLARKLSCMALERVLRFATTSWCFGPSFGCWTASLRLFLARQR